MGGSNTSLVRPRKRTPVASNPIPGHHFPMATPRTTPELGSSDIETPNHVTIKRAREQTEPRKEIIFWEEHNPRSLINLLTPRLKELARQLPPDFIGMSEKELKKKLDPSSLDEQLRIAFWDEYFLTVDNNAKSMRMEAVFARVTDREMFYEVVKNPLRLAYMLKPPQDYFLQMRSLLNIGLIRFEEVLKLPLENPNGTINTKLIGELIKIVSIVDNRVKGAVTQKIQIDAKTTSTSQVLNVNTTYEPPKTHQQIQQELKDIEKEIRQLQVPNESIFYEGESSYTPGETDEDAIVVEATRTEA